MADSQQIIERIRAFMASTDQARSAELVMLAEVYATMCRDANTRLRRARDYLRRGLRAEAIHEADEEPPLLDAVALLDIPEARDWTHVCALYELMRPPPLLIEAAQELNEAYAVAQPLVALLKRHRRLAIQRAPVSQRLAVIRELVATDIATPFWEDDQKLFESARLREIATEAAAAAKREDREAVGKLREEVTASAWRTPVPAELQQLIEQTDTAWRREDAQREIARILPDLDTAYSAMDFDTAVMLLRQVRQLVADSGLEVSDAMAARIKPIRDWAATERTRRENHKLFEAACAQLSLAIDADAPPAELDRLRHEAVSLGFELPPELNRKLRAIGQRREATIARRRFRSRLIVGGIILGCCIMLGLVMRTIIRDRRAGEAYMGLSRLVGEEKWDDARKAWNQLKADTPTALDRDDFKKLHTAMDDADTREQTRKESFVAKVRQVAAAAPERPDLIALADAETLARTPEEKLQLTELRTKIDAARKEARDKQQQQLHQQLASLTTETQWVETEAKAGRIGPTHGSIAAALATATRLATDDKATADVKQEAGALAARLKSAQDALVRAATEREAMADVLRAVTSPPELGTALLAYAQRVPPSPRTAAFKQAAADAGAWDAVEEGAKLIEPWDGKLRAPSASIGVRVDGIAGYLAKFPQSPLAPALERYRSYLTTEQRALASDGPWRGDLSTLLTSPILKDFKSIRATDGKMYYLVADAVPKSDSLGNSFNAVMSGDAANTRRISLKPAQMPGGVTDSPQSMLSRDLLKRLISLSEANWETFGLDTIDAILSQKEIDPVLQIILLNRVGRLAEAGVWGADDALKALQAIVGELNADDIPWMNPTDNGANQAREKARAILARLSPLKEVRGAITSTRDAMFAALRLKVVGHGILLRDGSDWIVTPAVKAEPGQQAWIVTTDNGHKIMTRIGGTVEGKMSISADAVQGAGEGTMVFLLSGAATTGG